MSITKKRIEILSSMLDESPNDVFLHYALAMEFLGTNDTDNALEKFRFIQNNYTDYLPVYYQLGLILINIGREEEATTIIKEGIELAIAQKEDKTKRELEMLLNELD